MTNKITVADVQASIRCHEHIKTDIVNKKPVRSKMMDVTFYSDDPEHKEFFEESIHDWIRIKHGSSEVNEGRYLCHATYTRPLTIKEEEDLNKILEFIEDLDYGEEEK